MRARVMMDEQNGLWTNPDEYGIIDPENFNGSQGPTSSKGGRGRSKDKRNRSQGSPQSQARGGKQSSMIEKEMQ